jgi:hypothetical protein
MNDFMEKNNDLLINSPNTNDSSKSLLIDKSNNISLKKSFMK